MPPPVLEGSDESIGDGESVTFDDVAFTVIDLGPSESPHDSPWVLGEEERVVFLGDQIYGHKHCYLADGFHQQWLDNIEVLSARFPSDAVFHIGHGGPAGPGDWDWQRSYIETFLEAVGAAEWSSPEQAQAEVVAEMKRFLPAARHAAFLSGSARRSRAGPGEFQEVSSRLGASSTSAFRAGEVGTNPF